MIGEVVSAFRRSLGWTLVLFLACVLVPRAGSAAPCYPELERLCLNGSRFQAEVSWAVPGLGTGQGKAVPLTGDTGAFWFFSSSNLELVVKVLDGRGINRHFWVFYGGLSDVEYTLTVTDTQTGVQETYHNPKGRLTSASDVTAFAEEAPPALARTATAADAVPGTIPQRAGAEFQANVETQGLQWMPTVAMAPDGGYLVVWAAGSGGVYGRLYDAAGKPRTGEFRVSDPNADPSQYAPRVAASSKGGFLVVWPDGGPRAKGRFVAANGQPLGGEIRFGVLFRNQQFPDVAADAEGNYVVVWLDGIPSQMSVHAQRLGDQGGNLSAEAALSAVSLNPPRVAASPFGGSVVTWVEQSGSGGALTSRVWAQRLDASAQSQGGAVDVTSGSVPGRIISSLPVFYADGGFSVLWSRTDEYPNPLPALFGRRFGPVGDPVTASSLLWEGELQGHPYFGPAAMALPTGETWVLWGASGVPVDPDAGVVSGVFDRSWNLRGGLSRINTYTFAEQSAPAVSSAGGNAVAVWQSGVFPLPIDPEPPSWQTQGQDGSYLGIFGQTFKLSSCAANSSQLCLNGRFRVAVRFTDPRNGQAGTGQAIPLTSDTGAFWFFDAANLELIVKVLDGRGINGRFWVYMGALSDVAYTVTVTDTVTGKVKTYRNAAHQLASRADTSAF
jgi:hypothetical protein